nr:DUF1146 family protein [Bacillus altitudinis]
MKKPKIIQATLLIILITIPIPSTLTNFFLHYLNFSTQIPYIF